MTKKRDIDLMILRRTLAALLGLVILVMACQLKNEHKDSVEAQVASLVCSCSRPIGIFNEELSELAASDKKEELSARMAQGDQIMETAVSCITDKLNDNAVSLDDDQTRILINAQCQLDARIVDDLLLKVRASI